MDDKPNAPMTPREYVEGIVLPTLHEALGARDDRRRAYLACLVVCHVADSIGVAEAARRPGFATLSKGARKDASEAAAGAARDEAVKRCGSLFEVVKGFANGLKHPSRSSHLPGSEEVVPAFALDTPGAGLDEGRIDVPGLAVHADEEVLFLDACAQQVLAAFVCAYPKHLAGVALSSFMDPGLVIPGLAIEGPWLNGISAWAAGRPDVAEVWLFGSRAKGTSTTESDVDLALVLMPGDRGHDWPLGNWMALAARWQDDLGSQLGRHVSLELFARAGEDEGAPEARASAILLWRRRSAGWDSPRPDGGGG